MQAQAAAQAAAGPHPPGAASPAAAGNPNAQGGYTATTTPSGLTGVSITYASLPTAPTNAGSYAIVASLNNLNYQAPDATGTLVVDKATATISHP